MPAIGHKERRFLVRQSQQRRTGGVAFAGELSGEDARWLRAFPRQLA